MPTSARAALRSPRESSVAKLAKLFPAAKPLGVSVRLSRVPSARNAPEVAVIEFATSSEVLFSCASPLEFAERVRLQNADGSLDVEASVVAVQYHEGEIAVAARFDSKISNWIVTI